jgi:hypothetical protein
MDKQLLKDLLDKHDESFNALRRAEDQLDFALESNRSITRALREARKARNQLIKSVMEANQLVLRAMNEDR